MFDLKNISAWNLPNTIVREYDIKGITKMFDWQVKCLTKPKVFLENGNLIYSAPTSAGKTLVSEILMIKTIIERNKKALFILPFISVVREKMLYLQDILTSSGYRVEGYFGGYSPPGCFESIHVAICTIEKANSIVNKLLEEGKLDEIGIVVVDEIHLITDIGRGYILELLLTKIMYMTKKFKTNIQIVGMSATLTNIEILKQWLNADLYITDYRPVTLNEMIKVGNKVYDNTMKFVRELNTNDIIIQNDQDHIAYLCIETILDKCSILIFCPSKDWCETLSTHIARSIHNLSKQSNAIGIKLKTFFESNRMSELKAELQNLPFGLETALEKIINYGCAFHHAGLTIEERDIIERNFKNGILKVIIATSTLSSGVNLPARRVIIRSPLFGGKQMDSLTYRQMIGRAGRTGIDIMGESILICNENNLQFGKNLVTCTSYDISSCLGLENSMPLKRAILEVIAAGVTKSKKDIQNFLECTLYGNECAELLDCDKNINCTLDTCLDFLIEYEFIRLQHNDELNEKYYIPTRLGKACLASSLPTNDALSLLAELQKSRRSFVLESDLHAVYLVTPYSVCYQINNLDWLLYIELWEKMPLNLKKVGELIGVKEAFLVQAMRGHSKLGFKALQIHKRASSLPTNDALSLLAELQKSRRSFVLESDLHAVYLVTPYSVCYQINNLDWLLYIELWEKMPLNLKKVGELIGVKEAFLVQAMRGHSKLGFKALQIHKRFYIALALNDLINEVPLDSVAKKYNCNRGLLQSLQQSAATFSGVVNAFCKSLNWHSLALIISQFKERLYFGVHQDLIDLIKLPDINSQRARALYNSGITNLRELANSDIYMVENVLHNCLGFETAKQYDDEDEIEANKRKDNRNVHITGSRTLTVKEAAAKFISDARKFLEFEIGAKNIEWNSIDLKDDIQLQSINVKIQSETQTKHNITKENSQHSIRSSTPNLLEKINHIPVPIPINQNKTIRNVTINMRNNEINGTKEDKSFHILSTSKIESKPILFDCIVIIEICGNADLFEKALFEILQAKTLGFSIASQKILEKKKYLIGGNLFHNQQVEQNTNFDFVFDDNYFISGISFCCDNNVCYFFNMQQLNTCDNVSKTMKLKALKDIFENEQITLRIQNAKQQLKFLLKAVPNICIKAKIEDPKIANWLLQPDQLSTFREMSKLYAPECYSLVDLIAHKEISLVPQAQSGSERTARIRSSAESCISYHILSNQLENLTRIANGYIKKFFYELEMPIQKSLMLMECHGFAVNTNAITSLVQDIREIMNKIEKKAHKLHGSSFNLLCTSVVAKVLGIEKKANGRYCTTKEILKKINSTLSNLIIDYRKLSSTLNNTLIPVLNNIQNNRIHGNSYTFTSTGRISMSEPNLQNIPKDYEITISKKRLISCRKLFVTPEGKCLVSGDFSQIEIRILAHLSQDSNLKEAIEINSDIFTSIAAKWNNVCEENVTKDLRNTTKQICYGIIYGMGVKTLSESLNCTEDRALSLIEEFHITYPKIRLYLNKVIKFAQENGYIETVTGRRRYLSNINNNNQCLRSQAERQAINSTIQGSAADITKSAILRMEKNLLKYRHKLGIEFLEKQELKVNLVHHIHDELMYEVATNNVNNVAKILKITMENCIKLTIPIKVNLKIGETWSTMQEIVVR